ncbi:MULTISPECIES: hypothetical protein [Alphaproteobacteria]|nr:MULTISPECIES: hypothetical protein [Alphaproteobacteria]
MPEKLRDDDRGIDRQTREMAHEGKLDTDPGSMVPPRWRASTVIVVLIILMTLLIMLGFILSRSA